MDGGIRHRRLKETRTILCLSCLMILWSSQALRANEIQLVPVEDYTTAFAGDEITIGFRINADQPVAGRLLWSQSAQKRTLDRGEVDVRRMDDGQSQASFDLQLPEVRDGIIYQTHITAAFVPRGTDSAATKLKRSLWLFPRDPLAGRLTWAEELNLELFDPDGRTSEALESIDLPFRSLRRLSGAGSDDPPDESLRNRVLLVGEGASLANGTLIDTAVEAALAGRRVIVLAPQEGVFDMPGLADGGNQNTGAFHLARQSVITEFDQRLDAKAWHRVGNGIPFRGLRIEAVRSRIQATFVTDGTGWPWLELRYPDSGGVLILCGFRIVEHWDNGPTPRYLLIRILESLTASDKK